MTEQFYEIVATNDIKEFYGIYFLLWVLSLLYIILHRKKEVLLFKKVVLPTIVALIIVFNPICAVIIEKCLQGSYWRVFWSFNICIVVAYVCTRFVFNTVLKTERLYVVIVLFLVIVVCGTPIYTDKNFERADNVYKIPEQAIEVCEVLQKNSMTDKVALDPELVTWVRQYDSTINTLYGRDLSGNIAWGLLVNNMDAFYHGLEDGCEYIVLAKTRNMEQQMIHKGYQKCAETEEYDVWKVR